MELPIDHFRLLGVSPSAEAETVLRTLQLRFDRAPDQGFTDESLSQRAELLRASADLLTDPSNRQEYETALLGGASGLELPSNREVAGLILLWEAEASLEAFKRACRCLQPPQAPALGSGRESDLTLVAALSCRAAALQEQEQRHYESASALLQEGLKLLQRMGKLPDQRRDMEKDLEALLPYRILDLVSRDLGDLVSRKDGLRLLDNFVTQRGGLEGRKSSNALGGLEQPEFELFFQQIRKFLTVQEQVDLFIRWQKLGSSDAGFLGVLALTAAGFSRRKPEGLYEARKYLKRINHQGLDPLPMLGCLDLLLADVQRAHERFENSLDSGLKNWLANYPGDYLEALCEYCRDWLKRDVLPGYRDVDAEVIDLEAWFADRDVQSYIERLDRRGARGIARASFSFLSSLSAEQSQEDLSKKLSDSDEDLTIQNDIESEFIEDGDSIQIEETSPERVHYSLGHLISWPKFLVSKLFSSFSRMSPSRSTQVVKYSVFLALVAAFAGLSFGLGGFRQRSLEKGSLKKAESSDSSTLVENLKPNIDLVDSDLPTEAIKESESINPLKVERPNQEQLTTFLENWLTEKAVILSGGKSESLPQLATKPLLKFVQKQRRSDSILGQTQIVETKIISLQVIKRKPKSIEMKAKVAYRDKRLSSSGEIISETSIPGLKVTYTLVRDGDTWRLANYISGS